MRKKNIQISQVSFADTDNFNTLLGTDLFLPWNLSIQYTSYKQNDSSIIPSNKNDIYKQEINDHLEIPETISEKKRLENELATVVHESLEENWDGYNAAPINKESISAIMNFIERKKSDIPRGADIVPNADGTVCLEWEDIDKRLLISFKKQDLLLFSYVSNYESFFGTAKFEWHSNLANILKKFE